MVSLPHRSTHISIHKSNGKPESSVTPGLDRVCKEAKRGSHKTLHVVILFVLDHKTGTRGLGQCSTRQPTVDSYIASHRSPLLRWTPQHVSHSSIPLCSFHPDSQSKHPRGIT